MPYIGGPDGRVALRLLLQLAENPEITATVVYYPNTTGTHEEATVTQQAQIPKAAASNLERTFSSEDDAVFFATLQRSLTSEIEARVFFDTAVPSSTPLEDMVARAQSEVGQRTRRMEGTS